MKIIAKAHTQNDQIATLGDYLQLLKPRVMSLAIFTALCGMLSAPGEINPVIGFAGIFAIALGAGAAGCLNMWWERSTDSLMDRTKMRPIPQGIISAETALSFGIILSCFSVFTLAVCVNYTSAALLAFTIISYAYVYTVLLKPSTPQNIVIGGASGALPPVIGWSCVNGEIGYLAIVMFVIIFLWTPPHFWALALKLKADFAKANLPMMPNVRGDHHTKKLIVMYSLFLCTASYAPTYLATINNIIFISLTSILNSFFMWFAVHLWRSKDNKKAMKFFTFSIIYLFSLFLLITLFSYLGS